MIYLLKKSFTCDGICRRLIAVVARTSIWMLSFILYIQAAPSSRAVEFVSEVSVNSMPYLTFYEADFVMFSSLRFSIMGFIVWNARCLREISLNKINKYISMKTLKMGNFK